jgi:membrane protein DedA with SNARE-associated domain/rhodanese-related sulfurtransferase
VHFFSYLLLRHGYALLFCYVVAAALGFPIPVDPVILVLGSMVGHDGYTFWHSFFVAILATIIGDQIWYHLGRIQGSSILKRLCKLSLEPDTCIQRTGSRFYKRGPAALLIVKFIPGVSVASVALAGVTKMPIWRFMLFDTLGAAFWAGSYLLLGLIFHHEVNTVISLLGLFGRRAGLILLCLLGAYIGGKYLQRWLLIRQLRTDRISPHDVFDWMQANEPVTIVDLRNPAEVAREGVKIAGALVIRPDELRIRASEIPSDRDIVLYCTCPNEATSARVALQLRKAGIKRVRPLAGGLERWLSLGYPTQPAIDELAAKAVPVEPQSA